MIMARLNRRTIKLLLMPSNTEILYELGLGKYIVGVSTVDDIQKM